MKISKYRTFHFSLACTDFRLMKNLLNLLVRSPSPQITHTSSFPYIFLKFSRKIRKILLEILAKIGNFSLKGANLAKIETLHLTIILH